MESIYTVEEVSKHLRVPLEAVEKEIERGRLQAFDVAGLVRISEYALEAYKKTSIAKQGINAEARTQSQNGGGSEWLKLQSAKNFTHRWPDDKVEEYKDVREGVAIHAGRQYHIKLGQTVREMAGEQRLRWLVLVDRYPTVEFVKCDDDKLGGTEYVASIIKDRRGKQIPPLATLPPEYEQLPTSIYSEEIKGRGIANGQAVVCAADDFATMVRHALIRSRFRQERK
jgi:excisionase family DNA binding protein